MDYSKATQFSVATILVVSLARGTFAKSLAQADTTTYQQQSQSQHNGDMEYPAYPGDNSEMYDTSSSEEVMPVKNPQFVPVESSDEDYSDNNNTGFVPQRQVSLTKLWSNPAYFSNVDNMDVKDEGNIEEIATEYSPRPHPHAEDQYHYHGQYNNNYPQPQQPAPQMEIIAPAEEPPKIKKHEGKLVVEARQSADGKIAVLVDVEDKRARATRSNVMMTLSREDENDSEYDDLDIANGKTSTQSSAASTTSSTAVPIPTMKAGQVGS